MTSHEKRVSALMRLHGLSKAAAEKRARIIESKNAAKPASVKKNPLEFDYIIRFSDGKYYTGEAGPSFKGAKHKAFTYTEKGAYNKIKLGWMQANGAEVVRYDDAKENPVSSYRGKYPLKVKQVASTKEKGVVSVTLNNGDRFTVTARETGGLYPEVGKAMSSAVLTAYSRHQHAKVPVKKNPVQSKLQARPKPAGKLARKVFTVEAKHGEKWVTEGFFPSEESAKEYAHALNRKYSNKMAIRVTV